MSRLTDLRDDLAVESLVEAKDELTYARRVLRARVLIGTATRWERLRFRLGLGPPRWMREAARYQVALRRSR